MSAPLHSYDVDPKNRRIEADEIKAAATGRWVEILSNLGGVDAAILDEKPHPCPKCGGKDRFRMIDESRGALFCNQCFNERNGDGLSALGWLLDKRFPEVIDLLADYLHLSNGHHRQSNGNTNGHAKPSGKSKSQGFKTAPDCIDKSYHQLGPVSRTWEYHDKSGQVVGVVGRWDLPDGDKTYRPVALINGTWQAGGMPDPSPLYRLPDMLGSTGRVFVCEGEKDADALRSIGLTATTSAHGAKSARKADWSPLAGRDVVLWPDNDESGTEYVSDVKSILERLDPQPTVRFIKPDGLPYKGGAYDWCEQREAADWLSLQAELTALADAAIPVVKPAPKFAIEFIDSAAFSATSYRQRFLVQRVLVAGQPAILGGAQKTLKTSIAVDLAFSLGTGTPFLGTFHTTEAVRVGILSGESGGFTLQETARRIANARGLLLSSAQVWWGFKLPQLGLTAHLEALAKAIEANKLQVLVVDPAYLTMLTTDDGKPINFGVLFEMGAVLSKVSETFSALGCTLVLLHHESKGAASFRRRGDNGPPELQDLSMSGFAEWARQWLLIGRREAYEHGSGLHRLWLNAGGSAGHGGLWAVDVDEGQLQEDFSGRVWSVSVNTAETVRQTSTDQKEQAVEQRQTERVARNREKILTAFAAFPDGTSKRRLRTTAGLNPDNFDTAFETILRDKLVEACTIKGDNGRDYDGFKLTESEENGPNGTERNRESEQPLFQ